MASKRASLLLIAIAVAALPASPPLLAHDLWIAPSSFTPALGEPIRLHLVLANGEQIETVPRSDAGIVRFLAVGPQGDQPVAGLDGLDPAGFLRPTEPGWYTILYQSAPAFTTLAPDTFRAYLLEKGLDAGTRTQPASGPAEPTTSEIFRRSIKARILVADPNGAELSDPGEEKPAGLPLELILERAAASGEPASERDVVMRLLLDGAPLEGALVDVRRLDDRTLEIKATTDGEGRIRLRLGPGSWVATSVHLDPSRPATADWESLWSSLTFNLE
jgi:uncharacterized GH25 family protein